MSESSNYRTCGTCKHNDKTITERPCVACSSLTSDRWEPIVLTFVPASLEPSDDMPAAPPTRGEAPPAPRNAGEVLDGMAATFRQRNAVYGDNYKMVAPLVRALFPHGVPPELVVTDQWHLLELKLVKLSRFAISGLTHVDSIHDDGVYSAMIESIILNKEAK